MCARVQLPNEGARVKLEPLPTLSPTARAQNTRGRVVGEVNIWRRGADVPSALFPCIGDNDAVTYAGDSLLFHAAFFTADGAYVSGIGDHAVEYETTDNATATTPLLFARPYRVGRAINFAGNTPGIHTLTARWGGLSASIDIEVLDRPMDTNISVD